MNNQIHFIQQEIFKTLLLSESARFSDMLPEGIYSEHFNFHVKQVMKNGYVIKNEQGLYELTDIGKEFANRFDIDSASVRFEKQAKIGVIIKAIKIDEKGEKRYLVQKRLKQPFYGFHGSPGGKIKYGEKIIDAARRELIEETGLDADFDLILIEHRMEFKPDGALLEDKYFYIFRATNIRGELMAEFDSGHNMWLTKSECYALDNVFTGMHEGFDIAENHTGNCPEFREVENVPDYY